MTKNTKDTLSALLRAAVALTLFVLAVVYYDRLKNIDVRAIVNAGASVAAAIVTLWGIYLVKSVLFVIPASLIYIAVGMAFSPGKACLINLAGIVIEVTVTYFLGLFLGGEYVNKLLSKNKVGRKLLEKQFNNKFSALLVIRALPVFPIDFVSLFWGASKAGFLKYFAASVIGIMPRVILFTILGDGIYDYIPIQLIVKIIIAALPVAAVVTLVKFFTGRKKNKANEANEEKAEKSEIRTDTDI